MGGKPVITVIGSYAVGFTMKSERFPTSGETLIGANFQKFHGGKGSNQAVAIARMDIDVNFISCLGKDSFGQEALELYNKERVKTEYIKFSDKLPTGVGFIVVNNHGENIIVLDPGANDDLTCDYISGMEDVISASDVIVTQLEIPASTIVEASLIARKHNKVFILNPAPYKPLPAEIWQNISILTPNEKEAKLILGLGLDDELPPEKLCSMLLEKGIEAVVITLGEKGAYIGAKNYSEYIPAKKVDAVDTTGAGDTFSGALASAIAEGNTLREAVVFASKAAAFSVTKYGVIEAMPYRKNLI